MRLFDRIFRQKRTKLAGLRYMQPSDQKMWLAAQKSQISPSCDCLKPQFDGGNFGELNFHAEVQDTTCDAWRFLEAMIQSVISDNSEEFAPGLAMKPEMWSQIVVLPQSIANLKSVRKLYLYGSHLVRIPPEIGEMENLEEFDAYTSYRLHWLPYEITRCQKLKRSRMSTRALYGNYKYRPPFPRLGIEHKMSVEKCSVCQRTLSPGSINQVWISLRIATDVLPLLVNACSEECVQRLPPPFKGYVNHPHKGGLNLQQPPTGFKC